MSAIERLLPTPERRFSRIVTFGEMVFLAGVTAPAADGDLREQCVAVLERIDHLLRQAGSDKSHILSATIWLADIADFDGMNAVWDAWVNPDALPARATVEAKLAKPELRVEIGIIAAKAARG
jgi:enamine deaminase RidA (YjgF/YER057c/UK114 family)